ncbi:MAG: ferrochelatase [Myxococcota bacterium]
MGTTRGLLLVNLGTPDAPTTGAVRRYLREFLSDPFVIDLPAPVRWLLLHLVILPSRPSKSAQAYRKVWSERGSPLLWNSFDLVSEVARMLEGEFVVHLAMRYGKPTLEDALAAMKDKGVTELVLFPLYPQFATSSTESTVQRVAELLRTSWPGLPVKTVPAFFDDPGFLQAFADVGMPVLEKSRADHVLFSFHGLPVRHVTRLDASGAHCLARPDCCDQLSEVNRHCYRAQSYATARALAARWGLSPERYTVGFQSRLTSRWIQPFSDVLLVELAKKGVRRLAVVAPSFVADCLETLEEIGIRAKEVFQAAGGEDLVLVPSLNAHPTWVRAVAELARRQA